MGMEVGVCGVSECVNARGPLHTIKHHVFEVDLVRAGIFNQVQYLLE